MSAQDDVVDSLTRHAIRVERLKASMVRDVMKLLRKLEADLSAQLSSSGIDQVKRTAYQQRRLELLLRQTRETIATAMRGARTATDKSLRKLIALQDETVRDSLQSAVGIDLSTVALTSEQLQSITSNLLIEGAPSKEWWSRQSQSMARAFADQMRAGYANAEPLGKLVKRVRDIIPGVRRNVEAVVRTSVQQVANDALKQTYDNNQDVVKGYVQHSTLDARTTDICKAYSGKAWKLDGTPIGHSLPFNGGPPRHWNCRSTLAPLLKTWDELRGITTGGRPADRDAFVERRLREQGYKGDQLKLAKRRIKDSLDGTGGGPLTYEEWLGKQSRAVQDEALGPTRADLWRKGKIASFSQLVDQSGRPLTIEQLEALQGRNRK